MIVIKEDIHMIDKFIYDKPNWKDYMDDHYCYLAKVKDVYDADTITCNIDLGFYTILRDQKIRFFGINAPEMKGAEKEAGTRSRDALRSWILGKTIVLYSVLKAKDKHEEDLYEIDALKGKYGRWLGIVVDQN